VAELRDKLARVESMRQIQIQDLRGELGAVYEHCEKLHNELSHIRSALDLQTKMRESIRARYDATAAKWIEDEANLRNMLDVAQKTCSRLEQEMAQHAETHACMTKQEAESAKAAIASANEHLATEKRLENHLSEARSRAQYLLSQLEQQRVRHEEERTSLLKSYKELERKSEETKAALQAELDTWQAKMAKSAEHAETDKSVVDVCVEMLKEKIQEMQGEAEDNNRKHKELVDELSRQIVEWKRQLEEARASNFFLKNKMNGTENRNATLSAQLSQMRDEKMDLQNKVSDMDAERAQLKQALHAHKTDMTRASQANQEYATQNTVLKQHLHAYHTKLEQMRASEAEARRSLSQRDIELSDASAELKRAIQANQEYAQQNVTLRQMQVSLQSQCETLRASEAEARQRLSEADAKVKDYEQRRANASSTGLQHPQTQSSPPVASWETLRNQALHVDLKTSSQSTSPPPDVLEYQPHYANHEIHEEVFNLDPFTMTIDEALIVMGYNLGTARTQWLMASRLFHPDKPEIKGVPPAVRQKMWHIYNKANLLVKKHEEELEQLKSISS
jgi:chromosome segregation ATPase